MRPDSVILAGYYGFGNAGDELILYALIRKLRRERPETKITVFSRNPAATRRDFSVDAVNRWHPWAWIVPFVRASRFILGGGGLLQESTGPLNHLYYLSLLVIAKLFGCKTEVYGIGVDPIRSPLNRLITRLVFNVVSDKNSVRDELSKGVLRAAGVKGEIAVRSDPVFELDVVPGPWCSFGSDDSKRIAIAVSPWRDRSPWAAELAELCDALRRPVDFLVFFPRQDESLAREVGCRSSAVQRIRIWQRPEDLVSWIPEYDFLIATRFHALVLAALHKKPFLGIGNQPKVKSLCGALDQPFWSFERGWRTKEILSILPPRERIDFPIRYANSQAPSHRG